MIIEQLVIAIREKEEALQHLKAETQRMEKEIDTLRAAMKILEREGKNGQPQPAAAGVRTTVPETIRKAFP
jgi:chromosome segregation ATPase